LENLTSSLRIFSKITLTLSSLIKVFYEASQFKH